MALKPRADGFPVTSPMARRGASSRSAWRRLAALSRAERRRRTEDADLRHARRQGSGARSVPPASAGAARLPVIVFLHGGGWCGGTRTTGPDFRRFFAQDGFAMASIEYRLTPDITFPSNVEDVKTAVRWLQRERRRAPARSEAHLSVGHVRRRPPGRGRGARAEGHVRRRRQSRAVERRAVRARRVRPTKFDVMDAQTSEERATLQPPALASARSDARRRGGGGRRPGATGAPRRGGRARRTHDAADVAGVAARRARRSRPCPDHSARGQSAHLRPRRRAAVPHHARPGRQLGAAWQSVKLYEALAAAGNDVTLGSSTACRTHSSTAPISTSSPARSA